jgi:hypothetical protein
MSFENINQVAEGQKEKRIKELVKAFASWKKSQEGKEKKDKFNSTWVKYNGYWGLYNWAINNVPLIELIKLSGNDELIQAFTYEEQLPNYTPETAKTKLREAFDLWKKLSSDGSADGEFSSTWLRRNGYYGLYDWTKRNIKLDKLVASLADEEILRAFY